MQLLKLLMKSGTDRGYFTDPFKSLLIADFPKKKEAAKREFVVEGI